jgi:NAD-dependent deacetylase
VSRLARRVGLKAAVRQAALAAAVSGQVSATGTAAARLARLIESAESVVALTGAGISVPSGIPDFRSPGTGLWTKVNPMEVAHIDVFRRDPERFWGYYATRFQTLGDKQPNRAHLALVELERAGRLDAVITQNIDQLHARAGTQNLVEVHGSISHSSCLVCGLRYELENVRARHIADPRGVPRCDCGEALKPDVVLFGEYLPMDAFARAEALAAGADLMLCIGSSLEVYPVAGLPETTLAAGGRIAILTQGPTPLDRRATVRMGGDVVDELEAVLAELGVPVREGPAPTDQAPRPGP